MKFTVSRTTARWLFINTFVVSLMLNCVFCAASVVEKSTPDVIEPSVGVENVYTHVDHLHNSPETLKNGRNPGFVEDYELPVDPTKVKRVEYFDVPLDYDLQDHIFEVCEKYGVDPAVIFAMIWTESSFRVENVGDGGDSVGLMQIQPKWHQESANRLGCPDLTNPYHNVVVGVNLFAGHLSQGRGIEYALMAYNGGASYANRKMANGEITGYVTKVLGRAELLEDKKVVVERVVE